MVTFGSLGGVFSPIVTARIAAAYGWTRALDVAALMMVAGGAAWIFVNAEEFVE
jgi:dipeptide/tripeptide permease